MKALRLTAALALALATACGAQARGTITVKDVTYAVDTLFHAKVGPGTTQTSLSLKGANPLNVFYLTIDKTAPGVSIRTVCAGNKVAGTARTSSMAESNSKDGKIYFAGVNGDFFTTSGSATNGSSKVGSPNTSCTVDGEVFKTSNSQYQFSYDAEGVARVCRLNYYTGTATLGDKVTLFKGINVASPNNGITIYTSRYWGSTNQTDKAGSCYEVTARLVEGDNFVCGRSYRMEVTGEPTSDGDTKIAAGEFVIHGRGTSTSGCNTGAINFVKALKPGDIVEFDNIVLTPEGDRIYPMQIVSGNPKNVGGGETLDSEGERNDASARHPRTGIGVSADGNTIIMMVIDGRSAVSAGVTTSMLADVMRYAGAAEAVNLDGGGSSTLYTRAFGVRNHCSDGNERAVGNAVFAVVEAPDADDKAVAEISFSDWARTVPRYGVYTPRVYAYNKYGVLVDDDFKDYTLTCSDALGKVTDDGRGVMLTGEGCHALVAECGSLSCSMPVTVDASTQAAPKYAEVLIDNCREWEVELEAVADGVTMPVAAGAYDWSSADAEVASVTPDGVVEGHKDGETVVTGLLGDNRVEVKVTVQSPTAYKVAIDAEPSTDNWTVSPKTGIKTVTLTPMGSGFAVDYTISSTRGTKLGLQRNIDMWSLPDAISVRINPGTVELSAVELTVQAKNVNANLRATVKDIAAGAEKELTFDFAELFDSKDIGSYPVQFRSLAIQPKGSLNTPYHLEIPAIEGVYKAYSKVDDAISADTAREGCPVKVAGDCVSVEGASQISVYELDGRMAAQAEGPQVKGLRAGIYVVKAETGLSDVMAKVVID